MPKGAERIRYAIYTRQSNQGLFDFSSCDSQFRTCQEHVEQSGEPSLHWTYKHFKDEGYSGSTLNRPGMRRLRKVIALGGLDRVYAVAFDRLSRNMRDAVLLLDEFEKAGVELRLVHQPDLDSTPHNRLLRHTLAAFAEFEREMITSRVADTRSYLKKHGRLNAHQTDGHPLAITRRAFADEDSSPGDRAHRVWTQEYSAANNV